MSLQPTIKHAKEFIAYMETGKRMSFHATIVQNIGQLYGNKEEDLAWIVTVNNSFYQITEAFTNEEACKRYAEYHIREAYGKDAEVKWISDVVSWYDTNNKTEIPDWVGLEYKAKLINPKQKENK